MKKIYVPLVVSLCFITFFSVGCSNRKSSVSHTKSSLNSKVSHTKNSLNSDNDYEGRNYKIVPSTKDGIIEYHYYIYNNQGSVIFEETLLKKPDFLYVDTDILREHHGGGNVSQYQFFNVSKNLISPIYENPSIVKNGKIVYMTYKDDKIKLVVSDLFDKSKFYRQYERDFSPVAAPDGDLTSAEYIDSNKLQITYLSGSNYKEVTEIIDINQ